MWKTRAKDPAHRSAPRTAAITHDTGVKKRQQVFIGDCVLAGTDFHIRPLVFQRFWEVSGGRSEGQAEKGVGVFPMHVVALHGRSFKDFRELKRLSNTDFHLRPLGLQPLEEVSDGSSD